MKLIKCRAQSILEEGKSENKPTFLWRCEIFSVNSDLL